jgi:hypothetical protein
MFGRGEMFVLPKLIEAEESPSYLREGTLIRLQFLQMQLLSQTLQGKLRVCIIRLQFLQMQLLSQTLQGKLRVCMCVYCF